MIKIKELRLEDNSRNREQELDRLTDLLRINDYKTDNAKFYLNGVEIKINIENNQVTNYKAI